MFNLVTDRFTRLTNSVARLLKIGSAVSILLTPVVWGAGGHPSFASVGGAQVCESAAREAARQTGVPTAVLRAISLTETGRQSEGAFRPWPWTVNMEGKGVWFDSRGEAQSFVAQNYRRGARSFDVGCFQLNYKWHGQAFSSVEQMFDPTENAVYAARYLRELFIEKGNWIDAAGAYHSRTPKFANRYKKRFQKILARLSGQAPAPEFRLAAAPAESPDGRAPNLAVRLNTFPLLKGGAMRAASLGSLMPADAGLGAPRLLGGS
jgi:Transglycosylase SLT domain